MLSDFAEQSSLEAEWAVLGAVMISNAAMDDVELAGADFYHNANRVIWEAIGELQRSSMPFDMVSVMLRLQETGRLEAVGGPDYLGSIIGAAVSPKNIKTYAGHVKDKSTRRKLAAAGAEIIGLAASSESSLSALDRAQAVLMDLVGVSDKRGPAEIKSLIISYLDVLDDRLRKKGGMVGIPSGFIEIDNRTNGFVPGQLIIIAGRPSMGKTTFALNIAENVALGGHVVMTFSMEMGASELLDKHFSSIGRIHLEALRTGNLEESDFSRVTAVTKRLSDSNMIIDDSPGMTIQEIMSKARKVKRERGLSLVVIDYLQLMTGEGKSRVEDISTISRGLKLMAKDLAVPVIALSQLNRSLEQRPNKRPVMSDLRESGAIEQDADIVMMLYRDEVYDENSQYKGIAECIFRKHRNGMIGTDNLLFDGAHSRFLNFEGRMPEPPEHTNTYKKGFEY